MGLQATRYAGTRTANVVRSEESAAEKLEGRHVETALKMAGVLGEMKGAAMKLGQLASFVDTEYLPPEYREIYQEQLAKLRSAAPAMSWESVSQVIEEEYGEPADQVFEAIQHEAFAAASIGQVHRAVLPDGRTVAVKIQYPGVAEALEADLANAGTIVRLAKALAPGLDAKAIADELRERVLEELDYEYEAQNQRTFARATYRMSSPGSRAAGSWSRSTSTVSASRRSRSSTRRSETGSARSSSGSTWGRSTTCSTSTPTPTPATSC
jgi:predicted unusual protein kinase regulating ubiquinone biosynthesis (AarF/ABC1/UbiB family)